MSKKCLLLLLPVLLLILIAFGSACAETPEARIVLNGRDTMVWPCGLPFADPGFQAFDAHGNDRSRDVRTEGEVTPWRVGDYTLTYTLAEGERTLASAERHVQVVAQALPETLQPPKGTICLTFDDGPCADTAEALDILAKYNVKACFFIVGNQSRYLDILPRIVAEGHTLGIHCFDHRSYEWLYKNEENYFTDLMQVQEIIHDRTGDYAHVLRFPGGGRTASFLAGTLEGSYQELYGILADMGIREYDWNVQPESSTKTTEGTFIDFSHPKEPYEYAVVLQHDVRYFSLKALESMIRWALDQGYSFAALDETFPEIHFCE